MELETILKVRQVALAVAGVCELREAISDTGPFGLIQRRLPPGEGQARIDVGHRIPGHRVVHHATKGAHVRLAKGLEIHERRRDRVALISVRQLHRARAKGNTARLDEHFFCTEALRLERGQVHKGIERRANGSCTQHRAHQLVGTSTGVNAPGDEDMTAEDLVRQVPITTGRDEVLDSVA